MLTRMFVTLQTFFATMEREEGQGLAEYGLILALVAVVVIAALTAMGDGLIATFTSITAELGGAGG